MRILLVHDSASVQKLIHHYFATEIADSYVRAADSTEATSWLRSQKFDLILCGAGIRRMNVSGLLCELDLPSSTSEIFKTPLLTFTFPREYGGGKVGGARASLLRLQVVAWTAASHATRVRTAWRFSNMPDASATVLHQG